MSRRPDKSGSLAVAESIDRLRQGLGLHLEPKRWTVRARGGPAGSEPRDAGELATFERALRDSYVATAIFAWRLEREVGRLEVVGGFGVEWQPARELLARLTGSEVLGVMLDRPTAVVVVGDSAGVSGAVEKLASFVSKETPELERLADIDRLIELLRQERAVAFAAHMADFDDIHGIDPVPAVESPDAGADSDETELIAALLACAGRYEEARQELAESVQRVGENDLSREHRRFVRQLTRFLDAKGELSLPTTPPRWPPPSISPIVYEPASFLRALNEKLPEVRARQEAVKAVRIVSQGKTRNELQMLLENELDKRGVKLTPEAVENDVGLLATEREPFGRARIGLRAVKALREAGDSRRERAGAEHVTHEPVPDTEDMFELNDDRFRLPKRAAYPIVGSSHRVVVKLDPSARGLLDLVAQRDYKQGLHVVIAEVWLAWGTDPSRAELDVHVGAERVGRLGPEVAEQLRPAMEAASERDEDPWTHAFLSTSPGAIPYVMEIRVPERGDDI
jgi:hypothetical protein